MDVGCDQYREALSAELDGESPGLSADRVAGHLDGCAGCRDWYERASRVTRLARLAPADPMPDLAALVVPSATPARRRLPIRRPAVRAGRVVGVARGALVGIAFVQGLLAWSGALTGQDAMATGHVAHEVGAWNLALAVAFLAAATRPRSAEALVAPVGVFVTVLAVVATADVAAGDLTGGRLAGHLLVATGLLMLVVVGRAAPDAAPGVPPAGRVRPTGTPSGPRPLPTIGPAGPVLPFVRVATGSDRAACAAERAESAA